MQVTIDVKESAVEQVMYLLRNLSDVEVLREKVDLEESLEEDLSFLETEIEKGLKSGRSEKSHTQIIDELKHKYV